MLEATACVPLRHSGRRDGLRRSANEVHEEVRVGAGVKYEPPAIPVHAEQEGQAQVQTEGGEQELVEEDLVRILKEPKNALTKQYMKLFGAMLVHKW